jgi:hypothetical protein
MTNNQNQENGNETESLNEDFDKLSVNSEATEGDSVYTLKPGKPQDRQLDTLARLLVGDEVCVAVCHHENKLLIASNKVKPEYAKEYLKKLQTFALKQNHESCEELLKLVVEKTSTKKKGKKGVLQEVKDVGEKFNKDKPITFRKAIEECQRNPDKPINFKDLQEAAQRTFDKIIKLKNNGDNEGKTEANQKWDFLIKWQDTGEIIEAIVSEKLDKRILEKIIENDIQYIIFEDEKQGKLHAEMKIIDWLPELEKENEVYVGISKLPCSYCHAVISILNREGYAWRTCADESHGKSYNRWIIPNVMEGRKKEIDDWKKENKSKKIKKETTSEIPEKLSNPVQILEELPKN